MISIFEPTKQNPYKISTTQKIFLRTACTAGVNRSATVREYLKQKLSPISIILPQYGVQYGDYDNDKIICINSDKPDGFNKIFNCKKCQSVQTEIFQCLGYKSIDALEHQILDEKHKEAYKQKLMNYYWTAEYHNSKNIFVIINNDHETIKLVIKRLIEINKPVDLIVLRIPDLIYEPINPLIESQSEEAYKEFLAEVNLLFEFTQ